MANNPQFGAAGKPGSGEPTAMTCPACEALLADALDGLLNPADQASFDHHVATCAACAQMVTDARRGMAWLDMLKEARPQPPVGIVTKILAQTSGLKGTGLQAGAMAGTATDALAHQPARVSGLGQRTEGLTAAQMMPAVPGGVAATHGRVLSMPAWRKVNLAAVRHAVLQPRLAMTAAMAFFSISLTLNLTGIRLGDIKAADLRPSSLLKQVDEQRWHAVRNFDNLRVVYEVEARVRELRRVSESDESQPGQAGQTMQPSDTTPDAPKDGSGQKPKQQSAPGGTSRREPVLPSGSYRMAGEKRLDGKRLPGTLSQPAVKSGSPVQPGQQQVQQPHFGAGGVVAAAFDKPDKQSSLVVGFGSASQGGRVMRLPLDQFAYLSGPVLSATDQIFKSAAEASGVCNLGMPERGEA